MAVFLRVEFIGGLPKVVSVESQIPLAAQIALSSMDHLVDVLMDFLELLLNYFVVASLALVVLSLVWVAKGHLERILIFGSAYLLKIVQLVFVGLLRKSSVNLLSAPCKFSWRFISALTR